MHLIPLVRTSRAIAACTLISKNPIISISISEIVSYIVPFINNSPIYACNHIVLFLFYYYYYNESAIDIINHYTNKYKNLYKIECISIFTYLFIYSYFYL